MTIGRGKLKSSIGELQFAVANFTFLKGMALRIEGNGGSDPDISVQYNIDTVVRQSEGVYRATLTQDTFFGTLIADNSITTVSFSIVNDGDSDGHFVSVAKITDLTFDISVVGLIQGTGNRIDFDPYDIVAGDFVDIGLLLDAGFGELPPA